MHSYVLCIDRPWIVHYEPLAFISWALAPWCLKLRTDTPEFHLRVQTYVLRTEVSQLRYRSCTSRMHCAMGTRSSGLLVLWLVIQKQSDGALERGFGCTWRSFGCRATESGVCTVTSRISGYSFQQRNGYTNTARLYYALGRAVPVFSSVFGRVDCYVVCLRGVHVRLLQIEIVSQTVAFLFQRLKHCRF